MKRHVKVRPRSDNRAEVGRLRQERGSPYYALKWGRGERMGLFDEREGDWNRTCTGRGPHRRCVPPGPPPPPPLWIAGG